MRETNGPSLPRGGDGDLIDRRLRDIPDGAAILLFVPRKLGNGRSAVARGGTIPRDRREALAHVTYFVALPFVRNDEGELVAGEAQERQTAGAAVREARRMTLVSPGAVAFSRTGDPAIGEFEDAVVIERFGEVPSIDDLLSGA